MYMKVPCELFFVIIFFTENPSVILNFKKKKKQKYMEFKSRTKMRKNYISELQRQNLILILKCCSGRKKTGTYYFTPSTYYTLLLPASISMDVQWSGNRNMYLSLGRTQQGLQRLWRELRSKAPKEKCQFTMHCVPLFKDAHCQDEEDSVGAG